MYMGASYGARVCADSVPRQVRARFMTDHARNALFLCVFSLRGPIKMNRVMSVRSISLRLYLYTYVRTLLKKALNML